MTERQRVDVYHHRAGGCGCGAVLAVLAASVALFWPLAYIHDPIIKWVVETLWLGSLAALAVVVHRRTQGAPARRSRSGTVWDRSRPRFGVGLRSVSDPPRK
jgi:hypothetical protein